MWNDAILKIEMAILKMVEIWLTNGISYSGAR